MERNLSTLKPSEVNHVFKQPQSHIDGRLTPKQHVGIKRLSSDVAELEKTVAKQIPLSARTTTAS